MSPHARLEAAQFHHVARRRGRRVAARGARSRRRADVCAGLGRSVAAPIRPRSPAILDSMGLSRSAAIGAFIVVLISGALIDVARGGDLVEWEPQRVTDDGRHWAYRIIDGRECWYPGRPGKPKNELYWGRGTVPSARQTVDQPEAETETVPSEPPSRLV